VADDLAVRFAEGLDFSLEMQAPNPVTRAVLRFRVGEQETIQRRLATIDDPGASGNASLSHTEELVRGQIAPASRIEWWWTLDHADGSETTTAPKSALYMDGQRDWRARESGSARVWVYGPDDDLDERILSAAETGLDRAEARQGDRPTQIIDIVTYRTREDMLPALVGRGAEYEERLATLGARVAPAIVVLLAEPGYRDVEGVLAHELSHVALHLRMEEPFVDAPVWLDEGLAMLNENDELAEHDQYILDRAIRDDTLMSAQSLTSFPGQADLVPLAYAQSHDLVSFLIKRDGLDVFQRYLDNLGTGDATASHALSETYSLDELALYQEYRASKGLAPAEAMMPPVSPGTPAAPARPCAAAFVLPAMALAALAYGSSSARRRT
jgi:hypothetical protein